MVDWSYGHRYLLTKYFYEKHIKVKIIIAYVFHNAEAMCDLQT